LRGRARDWNWHNAIGFWSAPILIVLTATALPISYRWAGDLIQRLAGSPPPGSPSKGSIPERSPRAGSGTAALEPAALDLDVLVAAVGARIPNWSQITIRPGAAPRAGAHAPSSGSRVSQAGGEPGRDAVSTLSIAVKEQRSWPRFATTQLTFDTATASIVKEDGYSGFDAGRRVRMWTRFLHTGEALGPVGQAVAGLASLGGVLLAWTGFALAWRRLFCSRRLVPEVTGVPSVSVVAKEPS
jgi:uncharacterized iron-regulated membrane protein